MPDVTNLSTTVEGVVKELGESTPVSASELVAAVLGRHSEYGRKRAAEISVAWPTEPRRATPRDWLEEVVAVYDDTFERLHGRALILGLALVDLVAGRSMVEAGLFYAIAGELDPPLTEALSEAGHERLRRIPLAALAAGALQPDEFAHGAALYAVALSRQGRRLAAASENQVIVRYLASGAEQGRIIAPNPIRAVAFSADGSRVVTVDSQGRVSLWPVTGGHTPSSVHETHIKDLHLAAISSNGLRAAMTGGEVGGHIWIVDTLSGVIYRDDTVDRYEDSSLHTIGVSPDGAYVLAYAVFGALYDYPARELSGGPTMASLSGLSGEATIAVGPGGLLAAVHSGDRLTLWRRELGEGGVAYTLQSEIGLPGAPDASPLKPGDLAVSPDGMIVATAGLDGVTLWSVASGVAVARLPVSGEPSFKQVNQTDRHLAGLTFSGDGRRLAIPREDGVVEVWNVGLEPPQAPAPVAGFTADRPDGADYLDIDNDVDAFASLIAARSVEPPLSIGLFGEWGSGKTFFMRRLRDRVAEITAWARDSGALQKDLAIYKRVAQIEFNAWHYSVGDLWAGLVEHLFTNLELYPNEPSDPVQARVEALLEELGLVRASLEVSDTQASAAQQRLDRAEERLSELDAQHRVELEKLKQVKVRDLWEAARVQPEVIQEAQQTLKQVGYPELADSGAELYRALFEARETLTQGSALVNALTRAEDRDERRRQLMALLVGGPLLGLMIGLLASLVAEWIPSSLVGMSSGLAALLAAAARWIQSQAAWANENLDRIDDAAQRLRQPYEQARARQAEERAQIEGEIARLQTELDITRSQRETLQIQYDRLEAQVRTTTPESLLAEYISDRADSEDYRRHLGLFTQVRRDFENISDFLVLENRRLEGFQTLEDEERESNKRINRIVLYIDDLDRCEPDIVVKVLQAVHLLLAFPLFVVVVGVDSRWVSEALMDQYQALLGPGEPATSHDYLEKIFQIPFWLQPLTVRTSARMLRGLASNADARRPGPSTRTAASTTVRPSADRPRPDGGQEPGQEKTAAEVEPPTASPERVRRSPDLNPQGLLITQAEAEFMEGLAPALTRSPRALKRFVNVYRLIKVRREDPYDFVRERGPATPYKIVMLLLAIVAGLPGIAARFFELLRSEDARSASLEDLVAQLERETGRGEPVEPESGAGLEAAGTGPERVERSQAVSADHVARLRAWLDDSQFIEREAWKTLATSALAEWAETVARYSFRVQV